MSAFRRVLRVLCLTLIILGALSRITSAEEGTANSVGEMPMRFYSGNLSVGRFRNYWGTADGDEGMARPGQIVVLKRTGCTAMCDYTPWCVIEQEEGVWDFSFLKENIRRLKQASLEYNPFCWLHFAPKWYQDSDRFIPYQNLETGETIEQISLWSPDLPRVFDEFYRRLAEKVGKDIAVMRVAMPSEYGELGYCAGMTAWLRPQEHAGRAYWCGDPHARADFRKRMLARHGSLDKLNAAWGTDFVEEAAITMPDPKTAPGRTEESAQMRRYWLDFVDWYNQAWVVSMEQLNEIIRRHFPHQEMIYSLGYGTEQAVLGNDQGRHIEAMGRLGLSSQSPGNVGYIATRRVSSACRHYGVPYYTEPPGDVPRDRQLNRIYMDLANGVDCWFDYLQNLDRAKDYFFEYKEHFDGADPRTTVALWLPTVDHWLHPDQAWPIEANLISEPLRDLMAYELVDDRMVRDGALDSLGIRHLILAGADWLDEAAWKIVHAWVEAGGILVVLQGEAMATVDGNTALWEKQVSRHVPDGRQFIAPSHGEGGLPEAYRIDVCSIHADGYTTGAWYQREPNGRRWTRPGAGLTLPVRPNTRYVLKMGLGLPPGAGIVRIEVDGRLLKSVTAPVDTLTEAEFTSGEASQTELVFGGEGWIPKEIVGGPDSRTLGAYISTVAVFQEGTKAAPEPLSMPGFRVDAVGLWRHAKPMGAGVVLTVDASTCGPPRRAVLTGRALEEAGDCLGGAFHNAERIDGALDGVLAVRFDDRLLYFNTTEEDQTLAMQFRREDFPDRLPSPLEQNLVVPARRIVAVRLAEN